MVTPERLEEIRAHVQVLEKIYGLYPDLMPGEGGMLKDLQKAYDKRQITSDVTTASALLAANEANVLLSKRVEKAETERDIIIQILRENVKAFYAVKAERDAFYQACVLADGLAGELKTTEAERDKLREEVTEAITDGAEIKLDLEDADNARKRAEFALAEYNKRWKAAESQIDGMRVEEARLRKENAELKAQESEVLNEYTTALNVMHVMESSYHISLRTSSWGRYTSELRHNELHDQVVRVTVRAITEKNSGV